jgi:hypothetical protein
LQKPDAAARRLLEIANGTDTDQCRCSLSRIAISMHEAASRFVGDLESEFARNTDREVLAAVGHRLLMAFIGRAGVADGRFVPADQVLPVLREARTALANTKCDGPALYVRSDLLRELERAINSMTPPHLPPPRL